MQTRIVALHDRLGLPLTENAGTPYERLASLVFKSLNQQDVVVHDLRLRGATRVKHQIDVVIETADGARRVLVECKDFEVARKKVGLGLVRNFWGAVEDTKPDEAIIVTSFGFTKPARDYAKAKNIRMAILRDFRETDREGRIWTAHLKAHFRYKTQPTASFVLTTREDVDAVQTALQRAQFGRQFSADDPVYIIDDVEKTQVIAFASRIRDLYPTDQLGPVEHTVDLPGATLEIGDIVSVPIAGVTISFSVEEDVTEMTVTAQKTAALVLHSIDGTLGDADIVVWEEDLRRWSVPQTGARKEVRARA